MLAIASTFDEVHRTFVEKIWAELDRRFGAEQPFEKPVPHFSYHVAEGYDIAALFPAIRRIATESCPFTIRTTGIGVFQSSRPVVTIPVVRTGALNDQHGLIWSEAQAAADAPVRLYDPGHWVPHITIARVEPERCSVSEIVEYLSQQQLAWEIPIDNLTVLGAYGANHTVELECALQGEPGEV